MKTFIFAYDRFNTMTTSYYLQTIPHTVLCHTQEQKEQFKLGGRVYGELIATGQPKGLSYNRNVALDMMQPGEWAAFWVDDLIEVTTLANPPDSEECGCTMETQKDFRDRFNKQIAPEEFYRLANKTIEHAASKKFNFCGFSLTANPVFRNKHYSYWALADGRCWLVRKTHLRFDNNVNTMDDYCFTALNLREFGGLVVNNWILPLCERYTAGGCGTREQRMEQKMHEAAYMVKTYPQYITYADKTGWPTGSHVRIKQTRTPVLQENPFNPFG